MPAALEIKVPLNPPRSVLFFLGGRTGDPEQGGENCDADGEQNNHDNHHTFSMNRPPRAKRNLKPSATDYGLWACHAKPRRVRGGPTSQNTAATNLQSGQQVPLALETRPLAGRSCPRRWSGYFAFGRLIPSHLAVHFRPRLAAPIRAHA